MKHMLRICLLALALTVSLCTACLAQDSPESSTATPRAGVAVAAPQNPSTGGTVEMYEKPDVYSRVLMAYYSGAPLEVLRAAGDMVQVQSTGEGASIMGYMLAKDLRYGVQAMREVPLCYEILEFSQDTTIYSYPDDQSPAVGQTDTIQAYPVCGRNVSGWVQVFEPSGIVGGDCGFVQSRDRVRESVFQAEPYTYAVLPLESELTREEAYEQAIAYLLGRLNVGNSFIDMLPEQFQSEAGLRSMTTDIRLWKHRDGTVDWNVALEDPQNPENNISVEMTPTGELIRIIRGNG